MKKFLGLKELIFFGISALCILVMLILMFPSWSNSEIPASLFGLSAAYPNQGWTAVCGIVAVISFIAAILSLAVNLLKKFGGMPSVVRRIASSAKIFSIVHIAVAVLAVLVFAVINGRNGNAIKGGMIIAFGVFMLIGGVCSLIGGLDNKRQKADREKARENYRRREKAKEEEKRRKLKESERFLSERGITLKDFVKSATGWYDSAVDNFIDKNGDMLIYYFEHGRQAEKIAARGYNVKKPSVNLDDFKSACMLLMEDYVKSDLKNLSFTVKNVDGENRCTVDVNIKIYGKNNGENLKELEYRLSGLAYDLRQDFGADEYVYYDLRKAHTAEARAAVQADAANAREAEKRSLSVIWNSITRYWRAANVFYVKNGKAYPVVTINPKLSA